MTFKFEGKKSSYKWRGSFEGVMPMLERRYKETDSAVVRGEIEKYMSVHSCPDCKGRRLRPEALAVTMAGKAIDELSALTVSDLRQVMAGLELSEREVQITGKVVQEITDRLGFLDDVGVGYLSLERAFGDALRRREPAHPSGDADRVQADGRALRSRRALDRPAPARQRAADRDAPGHARSRQLGARRRARRGHHSAPPTG
jgi:hypothetical protein